MKLTIESDPSGATLLVAGKELGKTPFVDDLAPGGAKRTYAVQKDGFEPASVTVDAGHDATRKVVLKKKKKPATQKPPGLGNGGVNPFE